MNFPEFKYYLIEEDATKHMLVEAPFGWEDIEIKWGRNQKYHGLFRSYSLPLKFVKAGANLIREVMFNSGVQGNMRLRIDKLGDDWLYTTWYSGVLDFTTFKNELEYCEINVLQGGLGEMIKARESVVYNIDIPTDQEIVYDGIAISEVPKFVVDPYSAGGGTLSEYIPLRYFDGYKDYHGGKYEVNNSNDSGSHFFKAFTPVEVIVDITIRCQESSTTMDTKTLNVYLRVTNGSTITDYSMLSRTFSGIGYFGHSYAEIVQQLSLAGDDELSIFFTLTGAGGFIGFGEDGAFIVGSVTVTSQLPRLRFNYIDASKVFTDLIGLIAPGYSVVVTHPVLTAFSNVKLTSGDALRLIVRPTIKLSLSQFFQWANATFGVGLGIYMNTVHETLVIDVKSTFYNNALLYSLGEVSDFSMSVASDIIYSHIAIGTTSQDDYDENNGKDEFNTVFNWSTPVTRKQGLLELVNPFRAGMYSIDMHRLKYINAANNSVDGATDDNPVFVLSTEIKGGYVIPKRTGFSSVSGLNSPDEAVNLELSPGRCLRRNGNFIASGMYALETQSMVFASCDKNSTLKSTYGGVTIDEDESIQIDTLEHALFQPFYLEFTAHAPANFIELVEASPFKYLSFIWNGVTLKGYIVEAGMRPNDHGAIRFKLLSHPDNTTENLIAANAY